MDSEETQQLLSNLTTTQIPQQQTNEQENQKQTFQDQLINQVQQQLSQQQYTFALRLTNKITSDFTNQFLNILKEKEFTIYKVFSDENEVVIFLDYKNVSQILKQAENMRLRKDLSQIFGNLSNTNQMIKNNDEKPEKIFQFTDRLAKADQKYLDIIDKRININEKKKIISFRNLEQILKQFETQEEQLQFLEKNLILTQAEKIRIISLILKNLKIQEQFLKNYLNQNKIKMEMIPLHNNQIIHPNASEIQNYFGDKVAIYFQFMNFYQKWLILPAIIGFIVFIHDKFFSDQYTKSFSYFSIYYAIIVMFWANIFVIFWKRNENEIQVERGFYGKNLELSDKNEKFYGKIEINYITGLPEEQFSSKKRLLFYIISVLEAFPILLIGFILKIINLNLKGFIPPHQILYLKPVQDLMLPGATLTKIPFFLIIFDILCIGVTIALSIVYKSICRYSTKRENHKTLQNLHNSYILKRFMFELLNRFLAIGYIAFALVNLQSLRKELSFLYFIDEIRRLATESVIPYLKKRYFIEDEKKIFQTIQKKYDLNENLMHQFNQLKLSKYDIFDDFIEVLFQFCYIILFAGVFPYAAFISCLLNIVEIKSDFFKLTQKLQQRPIPEFEASIGIWYNLLTFISIVCIYSNTLFLTESYAIFKYKNENLNVNCLLEKTKINAYKIEHYIFVAIICIRFLINIQPKWIRIFLKRRQSSHLQFSSSK